MIKNSMVRVKYLCTNELIEAVVAGLGFNPDDKVVSMDEVVVSIAGSGDIPFAIAPYVKKVYAVDNSRVQIDFVKKRFDSLIGDDFESFCATPREEYIFDENGENFSADFTRRKKYFSKHFSDVKNNFMKIIPIKSDLIDFMKDLPSNSVDKIYLSNALSWMNYNSPVFFGDLFSFSNSISNSFRESLGCLKGGGLVYDVVRIGSRDLNTVCENLDVENSLSFVSLGLEDRYNSSWGWEPHVYRKRANGR